jgi:hypothetical protein
LDHDAHLQGRSETAKTLKIAQNTGNPVVMEIQSGTSREQGKNARSF